MHTVVENPYWGVKARQDKMWVTWCYLDRSAKWESEIGCANIEKQINEGNPPSGQDPAGPYQNFPNYKTVWQTAIIW